MSTRTSKMRVSNLMVDTVKKDIKNMHLGVYPPQGRIRVAAPLKTSDDAIRFFVISRMPWIKQQQQKFSNQERESPREYVSGESHYFLGRRYRLNVISTNERPKVEIRRTTHIDLCIRPSTTVQKRKAIFDEFYRSELRKVIQALVKRWEGKVGFQVSEVRIRKMKTRWGTCNAKDRRIWLNLELAKKPLQCIDYVFAHELGHLSEKRHSRRFIQFLDSVLPNWEQHKAELSKDILGHFTWDCQAQQYSFSE
jgi:predicted metal-dependent hydrolase